MSNWSYNLLWSAAFLVSALGCKSENQHNSSVKFDQSHAENLNFETLRLKHREEICSRSPVLFFIGNAEHPLVEKTNRLPSAERSARKLYKLIEEAKIDLKNSMAKKPYSCETADKNDSRALLVFITDGPNRNDSEIETVWFKTDIDFARKTTKKPATDKQGDLYSLAWVIDAESSGYWSYRNGEFTKSLSKKMFELHLPTDLEKVVNFFVVHKPKDKPKHTFDQTIYMFKSHGSKFFKDDVALGWDKFYKAVNGEYEKEKSYHSFLFDENASDLSRRNTGLHVPFMKTDAACKDFAVKVAATANVPGKDLCAVCLPHVKAGSEGVFKSCSGVTETTAEKSTDEALSPTANDSLSPTANDSLSPTANDSLSPTANDSLSPTANDSLSPTANDSLSPTANDSLSPTANDSLGSSKTLVFADSVKEDFKDFETLAAGVSYTKLPFKVEGITNLTLPLKGSDKNPPMVFLDSCWGDTSILDGAFDLIDSKTPIVLTLNPNPMGLSAIRYGVLDYAQMLMYPSIQAGFKTNNEWASYAKMKVAIDEHIAKNGLTGAESENGIALTSKDAEKSLRSISTFVIKDKKVIE
jgi:hypothetical protein